jgi:Kef-type K+ transport system membrane component KefB
MELSTIKRGSTVAIVSKIVGCGIGARLGGVPPREALQIGIGMISRGEVGLIVASVGIAAGFIGQDLFAATVVMVLVTTLVTPLLLRWSFRRPAIQAANGTEGSEQSLVSPE